MTTERPMNALERIRLAEVVNNIRLHIDAAITGSCVTAADFAQRELSHSLGVMFGDLRLLTDALAAVTRERDEARAALERTCEWRYMDWPECVSDYETACGGAWTFLDDGIEENGQQYCHKCGGRVIAPVKPSDEADDDEEARG